MNRRTVLRGALSTAAASMSGLLVAPHAMGASNATIALGAELAASTSAGRLHADLNASMRLLNPNLQHALRESGIAMRNAHAIATRAPCLTVLAGLPLTAPAPSARARLERLACSDVQQVLDQTAEEAGLMVWPVGALRPSRPIRSHPRETAAFDGSLKGMTIASLGLGTEIYAAMGAVVVAAPEAWTRCQSAFVFDQSVCADCPMMGNAALPWSWTAFAQSPIAVLTVPFEAWQRMPATLKAAIDQIVRERLFNEARCNAGWADAASAVMNSDDGDQNARKTLNHVARAVVADWLGASQKAGKFATMLSKACDIRIIAAKSA